jgi:hypothetical protein
MQTRQCCIDCRACKLTHWVSLYLCIINNNFPANMKVIRALCWIHWACSEYPVTSRYSAKSYRFCNSSSPKLPSQCNDWRIDDTTLTPITRPCCISHSGTLFCLQQMLSFFSRWQVFDKCSFCFDKWLTSVGFALTNVCLLRDYDFYYSRLLGRDLACRVIYIVSIGRFHRDCGKKGRCQNVNPRQPQEAKVTLTPQP